MALEHKGILELKIFEVRCKQFFCLINFFLVHITGLTPGSVLKHDSWWAQENIMGTGNQTIVGLMQFKCSIYCTIARAPRERFIFKVLS